MFARRRLPLLPRRRRHRLLRLRRAEAYRTLLCLRAANAEVEEEEEKGDDEASECAFNSDKDCGYRIRRRRRRRRRRIGATINPPASSSSSPSPWRRRKGTVFNAFFPASPEGFLACFHHLHTKGEERAGVMAIRPTAILPGRPARFRRRPALTRALTGLSTEPFSTQRSLRLGYLEFSSGRTRRGRRRLLSHTLSQADDDALALAPLPRLLPRLLRRDRT